MDWVLVVRNSGTELAAKSAMWVEEVCQIKVKADQPTAWVTIFAVVAVLFSGSQSARAGGTECQALFATTLSKTQQRKLERLQSNGNLENQVVLSSGHLSLQPLKKEDIPFLNRLNDIPDIQHNFGIRGSDSPALGSFYLDWIEAKESKTKHHYFAAWTIRSGGEVVGYIHLRKSYARWFSESVAISVENFLKDRGLPENSLILSIGYVVEPSFRGLGYASSALGIVTTFAKETLGAQLILPRVYSDNETSKRVLLKSGYSRIPQRELTGVEWYASEILQPAK
jgi:RimJ/RimL family protein N-acetyltransferase